MAQARVGALLPPSWSARGGFQGRVDLKDLAPPRNGPDAAKANFDTPRPIGVYHTPGIVSGNRGGLGLALRRKAARIFVRKIGPQFHFNQVMRDFVRHDAGRTLPEALAIWQAAENAPRGETAIAPQFECNRHMREFFQSKSREIVARGHRGCGATLRCSTAGIA